MTGLSAGADPSACEKLAFRSTAVGSWLEVLLEGSITDGGGDRGRERQTNRFELAAGRLSSGSGGADTIWHWAPLARPHKSRAHVMALRLPPLKS